MKFLETRIAGAYVIEPEPTFDERGFFARIWDSEVFRSRGLNPNLSQCSISFNQRKGTLRGMHFQIEPNAEAKLVRCTCGEIYDVIIDLRPESPNYCQWLGTRLDASTRRMLYVPEGVAHGFQTLTDGAEVVYQISVSYHPESARGLRWDDPLFAIEWPPDNRVISTRDQSFPDYVPQRTPCQK